VPLPSKLARLHPAVATGLAAVLLLAPSLLLGTMASHSSPQNLMWAQQFAEQFRAGVLYPRWLPDSFDGLGAPVFYFYPPLAFWLDALLSVVTFDAMPVSYRLSVVWALLLWGSGLAMYAWLRGEALDRAMSLLGALAYMAAPYHLLDHYVRGALAEFAAYTVLPLIMLAIGQIPRRPAAVALLAASYAALLLSHLPSALLISVMAIPAYVLFRAWRLGDGRAAIGFLVRCGLGGLAGLGLAAIYLVPALDLQDAVSIEQLWIPGYRIEAWFLLTPGRWGLALYMMLIVVSIAAAALLAAAGVLVAARRTWAADDERRREAIFWALLCLAALIVMSGLLPWFWTLVPMIWKVQFPWRALIIVEFATVTALCLLPWPVRSRLARLALIGAIVAVVPGIGLMANGIKLRMAVAMEGGNAPPLDVKEYLPAGYPHRPNAEYADLGLDPVKQVPPIACAPAARACRLTVESFGEARIEIESEAPTSVTLRRFAFPAWQLDPALPLSASVPLRLVTFVAPAGANSYRLRRAPLMQERIGGALSALSGLLLLGWLAWRRRRSVSRPPSGSCP
jgi:hypothetical protein